MKLVKWSNYGPVWPSLFNEDWPEFSSSKGLNIYETEDSVAAEADVPGIPEDKVEVNIEDGILTISAEYKETQEEKEKKKTIYKSTRQTSFGYSSSLPRAVDASKAVAEVVDGVVKVVIPKAEESKPKKIEVKKKSK